MAKTKTPKVTKQKFTSDNVEPNLKNQSASDRYRVCYNLLFNKLSANIQKRVLESKEDSLKGGRNRDFEVEEFIKSVILLSESYEN